MACKDDVQVSQTGQLPGAAAVAWSELLGRVTGIHRTRASKTLTSSEAPKNEHHRNSKLTTLQPALIVSGSLMERP